MRHLPHPGYSWSFTQHAVGLEAHTLYSFLKCAAQFEGETNGYDDKITELMISAQILTTNERNGVPDAWRDYQQVLAEVGLIYSTKICPALTLTDLGHMFLAGEIGFSELIGIQALRYQYPNGQKSTIQARLRAELAAASIAAPSTLTELHVNSRVLVKPGLLIARLLLELQARSERALLSVDECQAFLLPCRNNTEWPMALSEILAHRSAPSDISQSNRHARRNIQDWFRLLTGSDFFESNERGVFLSDFGRTRGDVLLRACTQQEDVATFWIPTAFDMSSRLTWFTWYGQLPFSFQSLLRDEIEQDPEYVEKNYVAGPEEIEEEEGTVDSASVPLRLLPVDLDHLGRNTTANTNLSIEELAESLRAGLQKRHAKTLLHDRLVRDLAQRFKSTGATVFSDPDSVDLMATWPDAGTCIFEVKTVTRRNLQGRLRTAIGQVEEYAYRYRGLGQPLSDRAVVINAELDSNAWQRAFLTDHLGIGLICKSATSYSASAPPTAITRQHWLLT